MAQPLDVLEPPIDSGKVAGLGLQLAVPSTQIKDSVSESKLGSGQNAKISGSDRPAAAPIRRQVPQAQNIFIHLASAGSTGAAGATPLNWPLMPALQSLARSASLR